MDLNFTGEKFSQGDVNLRRVKSLPEGFTMKELTDKIVQPSETLGKAHKFMLSDDVQVLDTESEPTGNTITPNTHKFVVVGSDGAVMFHGKEFQTEPDQSTATDHSALSIPPGIYYVDIAREYCYDSQEEKRVIDQKREELRLLFFYKENE